VVGDHDHPLGALDQRPVRLGLEQVRRGEAGVARHPVNAGEQDVDMQRPQRRDGDRTDERVGRRPDAARQHDRDVGQRRLLQHGRSPSTPRSSTRSSSATRTSRAPG